MTHCQTCDDPATLLIQRPALGHPEYFCTWHGQALQRDLEAALEQHTIIPIHRGPPTVEEQLTAATLELETWRAGEMGSELERVRAELELTERRNRELRQKLEALEDTRNELQKRLDECLDANHVDTMPPESPDPTTLADSPHAKAAG